MMSEENKRRVLVVEDEDDMAYMLTIVLEGEGYEVIRARDGEEGLDHTYKCKPDLILLDVLLPKLGGYKVCSMLKSDGKYKKIPVVIITAKYGKEEENLGYEVGADAFFTKPFDREKLLSTIDKLLGS